MGYRLETDTDTDTTTLDIDGVIGRDYFEEFMTGEPSPNTVKELKKKIGQIQTKNIHVNINSPGGNLNDGLVIMDLLKGKDAEITTRIMGLSASAATLILQGGKRREMSINSNILIHKAMLFLFGWYNTTNLLDMLEEHEEMDKTLLDIYARQTDGKATKEEIDALMNKGMDKQGIWISAQKALEMGFIDAIYNPDEKEDNGDDDVSNKASTSHKNEKSAANPVNELPTNNKNAAASRNRNQLQYLKLKHKNNE